MKSFLAITLIAATSPAHAPTDSAAAFFSQGDFPAAAAAYEAVLRSQPTDTNAQLGLGTIRLYQNNLTAAEPLLDSAAAARPHDARLARLIGELMRRRAEAARRTTIAGNDTLVPFVTADPLPVVHVVANGTPANFIVDTGADVALEPSFAQRVGVKTADAGSGVFAGGLHAPILSGMLASLSLGAATAYDVPVHVIDTRSAQLFPKLHVDGIVGTTYFERFLVTIDYPKNALRLRPRSANESARFQAAAARANATVVPCYLVGDHFVFARARVNEALPGLFLFDSGLAGGGLMPTEQLVTAAKLSLNNAAAGTGYGGGGAITSVPFLAQRIAVGSAVQTNVPGIFTPQGTPFGLFPFTVWGAISHDFLRHYAYTVDFDAMRIVLVR